MNALERISLRQKVAATLLGLGAGLVVFVPNGFSILDIGRYTVQIMLLYLLLGGMMAVLRQRFLVLVCFGCSALLAVYIKKSSLGDRGFFEPHYSQPNNSVKVTLASFNFAHYEGSDSAYVAMLFKPDADVICVQEVTPEWSSTLDSVVRTRYPFVHVLRRLDLYGQAVYSRYPITAKTVFYHEDIPVVHIEIQLDTSDNATSEIPMLCFIGLHAPLFDKARLRGLLRSVSAYLSDRCTGAAPVVLGEFDLQLWAPEMQEFVYKNRLNNARRDMNEGLLHVPTNHILFGADDWECIRFQVLDNARTGYRGVLSVLQLRQPPIELPAVMRGTTAQ